MAPDDDAVESLPISLKDEFARIRKGQARGQTNGGAAQAVAAQPHMPPRPRRISVQRPKRPVLTAILSVFALVLLVGGVTLGPVVYRGITAYRDVFEEPVPHDNSPFTVAVNPEGTAQIVPDDATDQANAAIGPWDGKERLTILLLGVDRREDEPSRSDTMILVNIDPVTKRAAMLSIPRDMRVIIPGYGVHKINAAYAFGDADQVPGGGPGLTIRTIEANFGIRVHHYAQVDFDGFVKIIDTIGGLTIDVPYPIKDDEYPGPGNQYMRIFFQAGWQHMDGERALQYARTRHDDGDGRRSARQQQVLMALREQGVRMDLFSKAEELINEVGAAVRTDLQPAQAIQLARLGSEIDPASIIQYSLNPALEEQQLPGEEYFLIADWNGIGAILSEFTGETVVPPLAAVNPNYEIQIFVEDGTFNPGLGARIEQVLRSNGFTNVSVSDKPDLGNYPTSSITTDPANLPTAYFAAGVLGLDLAAINVSDSGVGATVESGDLAGQGGPTATAQSDPDVGDPTGTAGVVESVPLLPTPSGGAQAQQGGTLVIVIGDDAPDPAYFTADPFAEEPIDGGGSLEEAPVEEIPVE